MDNYRTSDLKSNLNKIGIKPLDIMVLGATGVGKSTTLNSFFQKNVATVGKGVDPETMFLDSYSLNDYFRLWDTPGLGDGKENDKKHSKLFIELMFKEYELNSKTFGYIDLILVIIDGSSRDMGTTYKLLNEIVVPNFQKERILVVINQADIAMSGREWCHDSKTPLPKLKRFLDEKVLSIQERVEEATGVKINKPVYYSAEHRYNIDKLFDFIIDNMQLQKRELMLYRDRTPHH